MKLRFDWYLRHHKRAQEKIMVPLFSLGMRSERNKRNVAEVFVSNNCSRNTGLRDNRKLHFRHYGLFVCVMTSLKR